MFAKNQDQAFCPLNVFVLKFAIHKRSLEKITFKKFLDVQKYMLFVYMWSNESFQIWKIITFIFLVYINLKKRFTLMLFFT